MLEVIQHQQQPPRLEYGLELFEKRLANGFLEPQRLGDCRNHERRVADRRQRHEVRAVAEGIVNVSRDFNAQTGLADPRRAD